MTNQQAIDKAAKWMLTDLRVSVGVVRSDFPGEKIPTCAYRGKGGAKCAVGALLPDRLISAENNVGLSVEGLISQSEKVEKYFEGVDLYLLIALQDIHDDAVGFGGMPEEPRNKRFKTWKRQLIELAEGYGLSTGKIERIQYQKLTK